jgi:transcriptional antiterminator NusG
MEKYIRSKDKIILQDMFPGYIFIKTDYNQIEFDSLLLSMKEEKDGIIRELKKDNVSALTKDEIDLLNVLLDNQLILRISQGIKQDGRTVVISGPLQSLQERIIAVDKKNKIAILDIPMFGRKIKAGISIMQDIEI